MATLTANTLVTHPETGEVVLLAVGGIVPEWAAGRVGAHLLDGGSPRPVSAPASAPAGSGSSEGDPPPKGGAGSGAQAWREYAAANNVEVAADASREDVVAALDAAGVRTE
ncbi:hypothetical protein OOK41_09080 [Micromonospora sp. NBC_01655]|uniref:hypothetical protein n=1 Tax=Micromonospora sp. NBC_01655 TaxID=2975983 RepID=UPI002254933F|nr:hypothetical protein [Micromonospora sp. NBC_01655]MCX4470458.1 hypothetical protein [Micromonospora sp. NBC_01655]